MVGPKGFGPLDGYGMLVDGFEHRPAMTMMNYNPPFYPQYMGELGFNKEVDFVSCYLGLINSASRTGCIALPNAPPNAADWR